MLSLLDKYRVFSVEESIISEMQTYGQRCAIYSWPLVSSDSRGLPATLPRLTAVLAGLADPAGQRGVRGAGRLIRRLRVLELMHDNPWA